MSQYTAKIAPETRQAVYARDRHECIYCGAREADGAVLTVDHLLARALGGENVAQNMVTCCLSCNSRKQALPLVKWLRKLERESGRTPEEVRRSIKNAMARQARIDARAEVA